MKFLETDVTGVVIVEPEVFRDGRGFFFESYSKEIFSKNGIDTEFVQDNHSRSSKGVLRGLHYQIDPRAQAKLVRCVRGRVFDVIVDIRKGSKTFGRYVSNTLSAENKKMIYIPRGFAHGFLALEEDTEFLYKTSDVYSVKHERGILWNDPAIAIAWPPLDTDCLVSEKDRRHPLLKDTEVF